MKQLSLVLFLVLLAQFVSAAEIDCRGYTDSFDVRVLDAKLRPVEGALVTVMFDRGASFGEQYFVTEPLPTNADGIRHFSIANQGTETRKIDCRIWINATLGKAKATKTVIANSHGQFIDLNLNVYLLDMIVDDQNGKPIENATVTVNGISKLTGKDGRARFYTPPGLIDYVASYYRGKESGKIYIRNDTNYEIVLRRHSVSIDSVDDEGKPVEATIFIFNESFPMTNGHYETEVFGDTIEGTVSYAGFEKTIVMDLDRRNTSVVVFDLRPPSIKSTEITVIGKRPRMTIRVADDGKYASGVNVSGTKVIYRILPLEVGSGWSSATTFATSLDTFVSDFPELESDKTIEFRIEIRDNEGNTAVREGRFVVPESNVEITQDQTQTDKNSQILYIAIVVIIIIVAVYIVKHALGVGKNER